MTRKGWPQKSSKKCKEERILNGSQRRERRFDFFLCYLCFLLFNSVHHKVVNTAEKGADLTGANGEQGFRSVFLSFLCSLPFNSAAFTACDGEWEGVQNADDCLPTGYQRSLSLFPSLASVKAPQRILNRRNSLASSPLRLCVKLRS